MGSRDANGSRPSIRLTFPRPRLLPARRSDGHLALAKELTLPTPPRQAELWTPPRTSLPRFFDSATAILFEQGLADPRGCEYRSIQITVGSVWGGEDNVETSGWVLPAADDGKPRYAIAWSGLVYPLRSIGGPADLDADVRVLVEGQADSRKAREARLLGLNPFRPNSEGSSIEVVSFHPIKVCLLLRLGRADLAEAVWEAGTKLPRDPKPEVGLKSRGVSYLSLASDLAWYHFDRALCAHMRGDDLLALADSRALDTLARAIEVKAEAMGFERLNLRDPSGRPTPYIGFLEQLPRLLADQERRARERANPSTLPRSDGPEARIAALIRNLDQVAVRQHGQPGSVVLGESPIIQNLIAEGDNAVEPLIHALRSDDRLTRSVGFHRDFFRDRMILGADQAAYTALTSILKTTNFTPPVLAGVNDRSRRRNALADQIQAYWEKNRAIPLVERWYRTLADDKAGRAAWLEAAGNITRPANVRIVPGGEPFVVTERTPVRPGERPALRGEPLSKGHEPTVTALLIRRVESLKKTPEGQRFTLLDTCRMAGMLANWDPVGSVPTLRDLTPICREQYAQLDKRHDRSNLNLGVSIARFTLVRAEAGDAGAIREYAEWIRTTSPESLALNALAVLEPLYRRPDDPTLDAAAAWLFGDPQSPWVPLIGRKGSRPNSLVARLIASPMVEVPAFRKMLLAALDDLSPAGKAEVGDNGSIRVQLDGGLTLVTLAPREDRDAPAQGVSVPIRMCDFYASQLARLEGAPAFNPCWSESRRNAGVAAMAAFLRHKKIVTALSPQANSRLWERPLPPARRPG